MIDYGHGVSLFQIDETDLDDLKNWRNNHSIWRWCRQNDLISDYAQKRWYERINTDPTIRMFIIQSQEDVPNLIGVCGLTDIDLIHRRAEFSLYIAPEFQGRAFSKPALRTIVDYGFKELNLIKIWGETFSDNKAYDMFLKMGFTEEGRRKDHYFKDGKYCDAILVAMFRGE